MLDQKEQRSGRLSFERILVVLTTLVFVLVIVFSIGVSFQGAEYTPTESILFEDAKPSMASPKDDTDGDHLPDIVENYEFGTNIYKDDTDDDGMDDYWEASWSRVRDPLTEQPLIDPLDPEDAFEDPDDDGYDFDRNDRIDRYDDSVVLHLLGVAPDLDYDEKNIQRLLQSPLLYDGVQVRLTGVHVMDNRSYDVSGPRIEREITVKVAEGMEDPSTDWLRVIMRPYAHRPVALSAHGFTQEGVRIRGDRVDVQGVFRHISEASWIEVRGGETFPNILEYRSRFASPDREREDPSTWYNETDPTDPDTDGDRMCDGWEVRYGEGYLDPDTSRMVWTWRLDPTDPGDAMEDMDGDLVEARWLHARWLWVDEDDDGVREPPGGAGPGDPVTIGYNLHEFMWNTDPRVPDTDNDSYPAGGDNALDFDEILFHMTDPTDPDTDGDGMWDGWEIHHSLMATNASDRFGDPDGDGLYNHLEFVHDTHPFEPDTDGDGMWDGWEVEHLLDPRDASDALLDPDGDQLRNIEEFWNGTDPRDTDTDRDFLSDYEEVVMGWYVTVDGKTTRYHTMATSPDTDRDDHYDDEDGDGNYDPHEEILDGIDNDGDSTVLQNNGIDDDGDGVVDDGRAGIPAIGLPEGVDEEHDLNDYNEVLVFHTNASNPDTDGEGLDDWYEWFTDLRGDEVGVQRTQPTLSDTDSDRLTDKQEVEGFGGILPGYADWPLRWMTTDPLNPDTDSDGLMDGDEVLVDYDQSTKDRREPCNPRDPDTDGDGMLDGFEFDHSDIDGDGLPTNWERENAGVFSMAEFRRDTDLDGVPDILNDWDGDGLTNLVEYMYRLDPWDPNDGRDALDALLATPWMYLRRTPVYSDTDGDLMPDWWETLEGLDPNDPTDRLGDPDTDLLVNLDEYIYDLDPFNADTDDDGTGDLFDHELMGSPDSHDHDGDGIADWWERLYGEVLDPTDPDDAHVDHDGDNWTTFEEWIYVADPFGHVPTDPLDADTDGDGRADDVDPFPVGFLPTTQRPLNPSREVQSLSPIRALDRNGVPEGDGDMDRDGLNNSAEYARDVGHTDPTDPDTDGDGMPDGWEAVHASWDPFTGRPNLSPLDPGDAYDDPDWDGINISLRRDEAGNYIISAHDWNGDGRIDPVLENESFCNLEEYLLGEDLDRDGINDRTPHPNRRDTDEDGIPDGWEALLGDADGDGLSNWWELVHGLNPFVPDGADGADGDPDDDGYSNVEEFLGGSDPRDEGSTPRDRLIPPGRPGEPTGPPGNGLYLWAWEVGG